MITTDINLNHMVRFKLTDHGRREFKRLQRLEEKELVLKQHARTLEPDDEGYCEMTLWDFANFFGPALHIGNGNVIESNTLRVIFD